MMLTLVNTFFILTKMCFKQKVLRDTKATNLSSGEIRQFFLDYRKRKQQSMGNFETGEQEDEIIKESNGSETEEAFEPDKKPQFPRHVKYVTQVCTVGIMMIMIQLQ